MALRIVLALVCLVGNIAVPKPSAASVQPIYPQSERISPLAEHDLVWGPRAPEGREVVRLPEMGAVRFCRWIRAASESQPEVRDQRIERLRIAGAGFNLVRLLLRTALPRSRPEDAADTRSLS